MSVDLDAYPAARRQRTPPGAAAAPTPAPATVPRMRVFSMSRDSHAQIYNVMISPRCQGPAVLVDFQLSAPLATVAVAKGIKIFISDDDAGGVISTATLPTLSGDPIVEDFLFKNNSASPAASPFLHGYQAVHTAAGARGPGNIVTLNYPINRTSFFVKILIVGENQAMEGQLRVLEGVDLTRFF